MREYSWETLNNLVNKTWSVRLLLPTAVSSYVPNLCLATHQSIAIIVHDCLQTCVRKLGRGRRAFLQQFCKWKVWKEIVTEQSAKKANKNRKNVDCFSLVLDIEVYYINNNNNYYKCYHINTSCVFLWIVWRRSSSGHALLLGSQRHASCEDKGDIEWHVQGMYMDATVWQWSNSNWTSRWPST